MTRQTVYAYDELGGAIVAGWYETTKATTYPEGARWDGHNHISLATDSQHAHEELVRTSGGRWVVNSWSAWEDARDTSVFVDDDTARTWLIQSEYDSDAISEAMGESMPEETGPGRPPIGPLVKARLPEAVLAQVDVAASDAGLTRSEWIRRAVEAALA